MDPILEFMIKQMSGGGPLGAPGAPAPGAPMSMLPSAPPPMMGQPPPQTGMMGRGDFGPPPAPGSMDINALLRKIFGQGQGSGQKTLGMTPAMAPTPPPAGMMPGGGPSGPLGVPAPVTASPGAPTPDFGTLFSLLMGMGSRR